MMAAVLWVWDDDGMAPAHFSFHLSSVRLRPFQRRAHREEGEAHCSIYSVDGHAQKGSTTGKNKQEAENFFLLPFYVWCRFLEGVLEKCASLFRVLNLVSTFLGYFILIIELVKNVSSLKFEAIYMQTRYLGDKVKNCYLYFLDIQLFVFNNNYIFHSRRRN